MSISTQPTGTSMYELTSQTANQAATVGKSKKSNRRGMPAARKNADPTDRLISRSQHNQLMQQLIDMMSGFMQTMIKSLMEMFQGMFGAGLPGNNQTGEPTNGSGASQTGETAGLSPETTNVNTSMPGVGREDATPSLPDSTCGTYPESSGKSDRALEAVVDDKGCVTVLTQDGYTIKSEGKDQAWTIAHPDGRVTRIWGDPHVNESDGDTWDFKERSSFIFGKNKVTVETVPAGNGETFSSIITIYNGEERVTITGLDKNQPRIGAVAQDGKMHDAQLADGDTYLLAQEANGEEQWQLNGTAVTVKNGASSAVQAAQ